jgi:hypothetical protein
MSKAQVIAKANYKHCNNAHNNFFKEQANKEYDNERDAIFLLNSTTICKLRNGQANLYCI